jgi:hypothetical protein
MYWASAGTTVVAREPVIASGSPQREVKPPLTTLMLSPLKKYVRTAGDTLTQTVALDRLAWPMQTDISDVRNAAHWRCPDDLLLRGVELDLGLTKSLRVPTHRRVSKRYRPMPSERNGEIDVPLQ